MSPIVKDSLGTRVAKCINIFHRVTRTLLGNTNFGNNKDKCRTFLIEPDESDFKFFTAVYVLNVEGIKLDYSKSASQYT